MSDRELYVDVAVSNLLRAAQPFALLPIPPEAPDDAYQLYGSSAVRISFGDIRKLREAVDALHALWRV